MMNELSRVCEILFSEILKNLQNDLKNTENLVVPHTQLNKIVADFWKELISLIDWIQYGIESKNFIVALAITRMLIERCVTIDILFQERHFYINRLLDYYEYFFLTVTELVNERDPKIKELLKQNKSSLKKHKNRFKRKKCKNEDCSEIEYVWYANIEEYKNKSLTRLVNDYLKELGIDWKNSKVYSLLSSAIHWWTIVNSIIQEAKDWELEKEIISTTFRSINAISAKLEACFSIDLEIIWVNKLLYWVWITTWLVSTTVNK